MCTGIFLIGKSFFYYFIPWERFSLPSWPRSRNVLHCIKTCGPTCCAEQALRRFSAFGIWYCLHHKTSNSTKVLLGAVPCLCFFFVFFVFFLKNPCNWTITTCLNLPCCYCSYCIPLCMLSYIEAHSHVKRAPAMIIPSKVNHFSYACARLNS